MMLLPDNVKYGRRFILTIMALMMLALPEINAQEPPPRPIRIYPTAQTLSFGAFYHGALGGSVIIDPSGARTATGDVVLLGLSYPWSAAMFEVHAHPGTIIAILNGPDVPLIGSPSGSMNLHIGSSIPVSPFVSNVQFSTGIPLYIGGTLTVGNSVANPPGSYAGTFEITIVRE